MCVTDSCAPTRQDGKRGHCETSWHHNSKSCLSGNTTSHDTTDGFTYHTTTNVMVWQANTKATNARPRRQSHRVIVSILPCPSGRKSRTTCAGQCWSLAKKRALSYLSSRSCNMRLKRSANTWKARVDICQNEATAQRGRKQACPHHTSGKWQGYE